MLTYCPTAPDPVTEPTPETDTVPTDTVPTVLEFPEGLPGFPGARRFQLEALAEGLEPFCSMRSLDEERLRFVVVPPGAVFEDYVIEVPEEDVERLGLHDAADAMVVVIVTVAQPPTANLLGPVVVNRNTGVSRQVILTNSPYDVRTPLPTGR